MRKDHLGTQNLQKPRALNGIYTFQQSFDYKKLEQIKGSR